MQGLYQHYKGGIYQVFETARHSETLEDLVVYQSCETGESWIRPLTMFNETVEHDGQQVPRFQKLPDPEPDYIDEDEEAEFIQEYLIKNGSGIISVDDIKLIIEAQFEFLRSKGLVTEQK